MPHAHDQPDTVDTYLVTRILYPQSHAGTFGMMTKKTGTGIVVDDDLRFVTSIQYFWVLFKTRNLFCQPLQHSLEQFEPLSWLVYSQFLCRGISVMLLIFF